MATSQLEKKDVVPYTRVGDSGWNNGTTPLDADNLNKSDLALFRLLEEDKGYVYQLIDKIDNEIKARLTAITTLNSSINSEASTRYDKDTTLQSQINSLQDFLNDTNNEIENIKKKLQNIQPSTPTSGVTLTQLQTILEAYLTVSNASKDYVTKTELNSKDYVTEAELKKEYVLECGTSTQNID